MKVFGLIFLLLTIGFLISFFLTTANSDSSDYSKKMKYIRKSTYVKTHRDPPILCEIQNPEGQDSVRDVPTLKIIPMTDPIPDGWRAVRFSEAKELKPYIFPLLDTWSTVALEDGKIDGSGYGCNLSEEFGQECGEKLIIRL